MEVEIIPLDLEFKVPARTSRDVLLKKRSWFILLSHEGRTGIGECGLLKGLSLDDRPMYFEKLNETALLAKEGRLDLGSLRAWPSIRCGWEMALLDLEKGGRRELFNSPFSNGEPIPINGLVWMGSELYMAQQIEEKINAGFTCIKLKIGAINFEHEIELLNGIRSRFNSKEIEIRVDANGAFPKDVALDRLKRLAPLDIHSIEQPIKAGEIEAMADLCKHSPIPIALDEELIPVIEAKEKSKLLKAISPQYIILKPSLVGGFQGADEWVSSAEEQGIGWWATSALESNIGLNAIAQWVSSKGNPLPQGLGTGMLYTNNIPSPLQVRAGRINLSSNSDWDISSLFHA